MIMLINPLKITNNESMKQKRYIIINTIIICIKVCNNIISKWTSTKNNKTNKPYNIITNLYNYSSTSRFSTC